MKKNRNANIELIRIFACLTVIALHTWVGSGIDEVPVCLKGVIRVFEKHGVPLFFMIMGFWLFSSDKSYLQKVKETIYRILIPSLIALYCYFIFGDWVIGNRDFWDCIIRQKSYVILLQSILRGDGSAFYANHLWFVFEYIKVIIWLPILELLCINDKKHNVIRRFYMLVCSIFILFTNFFYLPNEILVQEGMAFSLKNYSLINIYILYVLIGYEFHEQYFSDGFLKRYCEQRSGRREIISFGVYILCNLGICVEEFLCIKWDIRSEYYYESSFLYVISTSAIFIFFMCLNLRHVKVNNLIIYVADKTFYIYLLHYIFTKYIACHDRIEFFEDGGILLSLIKYVFCVFANFFLSLFIASFLKSVCRLVSGARHYLLKEEGTRV